MRLAALPASVLAVALLGLVPAVPCPAAETAAPAAAGRQVTILYTNDFHSAIDPIPAYWLPGSPRLGGAAQLATLANRMREKERPAFLLDAGDVFTGTFSFLSKGESLMEMMAAMRYDALGIGNHEFDYGSAVFEPLMWRARFPVLGANIYYRGTKHRWARPWTVVERDGVKVGVIGVIGKDAASVTVPSGVASLDFGDPAEAVAEGVAALKGKVDLIVVLAHQGKTGPMQTDAEARPDVQRDVDADIALAGAVPGVDVLIGGHAHHGIESPIVHPKTGTLIVQTYGYGTRLGWLRLTLKDGKVVSHEGKLLVVKSDELPPDPAVVAALEPYRRAAAPVIGDVVGRSEVRLVRDYNRESSLGSFVSDVMRETTGADVAFENAGGLRADLPQGDVSRANVLDALPFMNSIVTVELTGAQVREVLEQGLSLERGLVQVSGIQATYDLGRPAGKRLVSARVAGKPLDGARSYRVATNSFVAEGGDLYRTFLEGRNPVNGKALLSELVMDWLKAKGPAKAPSTGRLKPAP